MKSLELKKNKVGNRNYIPIDFNNVWHEEYQLLIEILETTMPAKKSRSAAIKLLKYFGSLKFIFSAPKNHLIRTGNLTIAAAETIIRLRRFSIALIRSQVREKTILNNRYSIIQYCKALLSGQLNEQFWAIYLDKAGYLISDELIQSGTIDHVNVYPRELLRRGLENFACGIILVHNHTSGNSLPSKSDIKMTNILNKAANFFGIRIIDHIIISKYTETSLSDLGYL